MSIVKRLTATLHASVDRTVASIENHDAIINATMTESRRAVATAKVRLARVESDGKKQEQYISELENRIQSWTTRAKNIGETDRAKALECLTQRSNDQTQLERARNTHEQHREMQQRMRAKVETLEQRVAELQRQHTELRSRDTVSRASTQLDALEHSPSINIDETFDRWEVAIRERELRSEYATDTSHTPTSLDEEFKASERNTQINEELDALLDKQE